MTTDDDRNILEEVLERGTIRVSVMDTEAASGLEGFFLDLSRALGAAVFGDPKAIDLVEEDFPDSFDSVANGIVDVSAQGTIPNLARDASRDVDFSPTIFVSEQKLLVPDDSGIESLADLSGFTVGTNSEANNQSLINALSEDGVSGVETIVFNSTAELFAAYDTGEINAVFAAQASIVSEIPNLSDPDNQRILDETIARTTATLVVDENQSEWADVVNWVTYTLIQAEDFGITSENVDDFLDSEDPAIRLFLGLDGNLGEALGLSNDFTVNVIKAVGNYEEVYQRNFDEDLLPRGLNALVEDGGILLSNPFAGVVQPEIDDITYDLSWEGENGYTMKGLFSFSSELEGSLITEDDLTDMQLAFFEPDGTLLQVFDYDFPNPDTSGEFNFNFDSAIDRVLRSGESDTDTGFDLGIDFEGGETGISFFTGDDDAPGFPAGIIALGDTSTPFSTDPLDRGGEVVAFLAEPFEVSEI